MNSVAATQVLLFLPYGGSVNPVGLKNNDKIFPFCAWSMYSRPTVLAFEKRNLQKCIMSTFLIFNIIEINANLCCYVS